MSTNVSASGRSSKFLNAIGTRSTCGHQVKSTMPSQPSYGFGTATREIAQKQFISDAHKRKELPTFTPGPGAYKHIVTTGKQPESKLRTTSAFKFGAAERFADTEQKRSAAVPGPGAYLI
jgi:hypothetical protein